MPESDSRSARLRQRMPAPNARGHRAVLWRLALRHAGARWACITALVVVLVGMPRVGQAVDCSQRFPLGAFALTPAEAALVAGQVTGFPPIYMLKKPGEVTASGVGNPVSSSTVLMSLNSRTNNDRGSRRGMPSRLRRRWSTGLPGPVQAPNGRAQGRLCVSHPWRHI